MKRKVKLKELISIIIVVLFIVCAIFATQISKYDYAKIVLEDRLQPVSLEHIFGTDSAGRDVFARLLYGTRVSILVGIIAAIISTVIGAILGAIAGYCGGILEVITLRIVDILLEFPSILLAMLILVILGDKSINVFLAISLSSWPSIARVVYAETLSIKENTYIKASESLGASKLRIIFRHILPNCFSVIIVSFLLEVPSAILSESSLSFLGMGLTGAFVSWGTMINEGRLFLYTNPNLCLVPGIAITIFVLACNCLGNWIREIIDRNVE